MSPAVAEFVKLQPKSFAMVFYLGVEKFVDNDKIHEFFGEVQELAVQIDVVSARTTPPHGFLGADKKPVVNKTVFHGQFIQSSFQ